MASIDMYTPGPWLATESIPAEGYQCWWISAGRNEKDLATVAGGSPTSKANARLIAAAPDLLEAILKSDDAHWTGAMRAAIAKAINGVD